MGLHAFAKIRLWLQRHGYVFAVCCIAIATGLFIPGRTYFAKGQWALLYLPVIVLVASSSGVRPALLAATVAFFAWDFFFLPPYHTLNVSDPKDWLSLLVFLVVGMAMGLQTGRMRWRESEALAREREAKLLNRFSSHLVTQTTTVSMSEMLTHELSNAMDTDAVALYLPDRTGKLRCVAMISERQYENDGDIVAMAQWAYEQAKAIGLPSLKSLTGAEATGWPITLERERAGFPGTRADIVIPLQAATNMEGVLYIGEKSDHSPYSIHDARFLVSMANQAAAFIERRRLQSVANQAEVLRETDRLKSAFVSSVSHELKTPLASVTATVSSLLEGDVEWDAEGVRSELEAIGGDLDRLNDSIGSLLDLSRLEANAWTANKDIYEFGEIMGTLMSRMPAKLRSRVAFDIADDLPPICVDFAQWVRAMQNLIENALIYSAADQSVTVGASKQGREVRIWVEDHGPGIMPEEREQIFEKFYRGGSSKSVPSGTGLGLAITREIVRSHDGRIWVEDVLPHGARFVVSLPTGISESESK